MIEIEYDKRMLYRYINSTSRADVHPTYIHFDIRSVSHNRTRKYVGEGVYCFFLKNFPCFTFKHCSQT